MFFLPEILKGTLWFSAPIFSKDAVSPLIVTTISQPNGLPLEMSYGQKEVADREMDWQEETVLVPTQRIIYT